MIDALTKSLALRDNIELRRIVPVVTFEHFGIIQWRKVIKPGLTTPWQTMETIVVSRQEYEQLLAE